MVSIGIIAMLIAILLPVLGGARGQGASIKSLSNARQLAMVIDSYAEHNSGMYPGVIEGRFYPTTGADTGEFAFPYWQVWHTWTGVVFDELPYFENVGVYISPMSLRLRQPGIPWPTSYSYSTSFVGAPGLWRPGAEADALLRRGARQAEVRFASSKALLWDAELAWVRSPQFDDSPGDSLDPTPMIFADNSGSTRVPADASEPIPNPFEHEVSRVSLHNTRDGVFGLDY